MFGSDTELKAHVRGEVGASKASALPEDVLDNELARAKEEITREVSERLTNGSSLDFYDSKDSDQEALIHYLYIRATLVVKQSQGTLPESVGKAPPDTISSIRRTDFGDQTLNYWRDRMVTYLNRITE